MIISNWFIPFESFQFQIDGKTADLFGVYLISPYQKIKPWLKLKKKNRFGLVNIRSGNVFLSKCAEPQPMNGARFKTSGSWAASQYFHRNPYFHPSSLLKIVLDTPHMGAQIGQIQDWTRASRGYSVLGARNCSSEACLFLGVRNVSVFHPS